MKNSNKSTAECDNCHLSTQLVTIVTCFFFIPSLPLSIKDNRRYGSACSFKKDTPLVSIRTHSQGLVLLNFVGERRQVVSILSSYSFNYDKQDDDNSRSFEEESENSKLCQMALLTEVSYRSFVLY